MKTILLFLAVLAVGSQAVPSSCDSCKSMVQNFIDASSDQFKMAQLKVSLSVMCQGTSHQSDCRKTVDKLDFIAYKLAPYLKNTESVCSKLQMCGESQFSPLSRLVMLYVKKSQSVVANDNMMKQQVCEECQASSQQLSQLFNDDFTSYAIKSGLQRLVCKSAGKAHKSCNILMASLVPDLLVEMRDILAEKELLCANIGFCSAAKNEVFVRPTPSQPISNLWKSMGSVKTSQGEELMSCFECTLAADTLIEEFVNKRQETADDIQKIACAKVVGNWTDGCNDFVHMYMSTVLYLTYNQFDGRELCTAIHNCEKKKNSLTEIPMAEKIETGCANCGHVEQFFVQNHHELHLHAVEAITSNLCQKLPTSVGQLCERSAFRMSQKLFSHVAELASSGVMCSQMC